MKVRRKKTYQFETLIQLMKNRQGLVVLMLSLLLPLTFMMTQESQTLQHEASRNITDIASPQLSIVSPAHNSMVSLNTDVLLRASARDEGGISRVSFYRDDELLCNDFTHSNGYTCTWNSGEIPGDTILTVRAYDRMGNEAYALIKITIK